MLLEKVARCCGWTDRICPPSMVSKSHLEIRTYWDCVGEPRSVGGGRRVCFRASGWGGDSVGGGLGASPYQAVAQAAPHLTHSTPWTLEVGWNSIKQRALQAGGAPQIWGITRCRAGWRGPGRWQSLQKPRAGVRPHGITPGAQLSKGLCFGSSL